MERRDFLKVLGVAGAGATATGCSVEPDRLIPYLVQPEEIVPGVATHYRTTCRECPAGCGMTVRTREGRAIKAEGSAASPISHGKLCARGQASLHGLYDPDRIPQALIRSGESWSKVSWDRAEQTLAEALAHAGGNAVLLTRPEPGSMDRLLGDWSQSVGARRVRYDSFSHAPVREANRRLYGRAALPIYDFSRAEVVVSFGADFMETWISPVDYSHGWVEGHAYEGGRRGEFIAVTPHQSLTDLNADTWIAPRPGTEHLVALAMARLVGDETGGGGAAAGMLSGVDVASLAEAAGVELEQLRLAAHEFASRPSLAVGPGVGTSSAAATTLAMAVAALNEAAGNLGTTVRLGEADEDLASYRDMLALLAEMEAGRVPTLLIHGPNPLYELPDQERVARALGQVQFIASFSPWLDETSAHAHLLLPDHHFLESWGDHVPRPGVHALVQPVMTPVYDTKQTGDVLLSVARRMNAALPTRATTFYDYLREEWQGLQGTAGGAGTFDEWWTRALRNGVVVTDEYGQAQSLAGGGAAAGGLSMDVPALDGDGEFALVVYPSYRFYDGRLANRPWLQELPDPITKHTWGSVLEMNPATADEYGLDDGHIVEVSTPSGTVELPVWRHPGIRQDTVAIQLGQGHERMGRYAKDKGVNALHLLAPVVDEESGGLVWIQTRADVSPTGRWERQPFSSTQDDVSGRHLLETVSLDEARRHDRAAVGAVAAGSPEEPVHMEGGGGLMGPEAHEEEGTPGGHGASVHPSQSGGPSLQGAGGFAPVNVPGSPGDYPAVGTHYGEYSDSHPRWAMAVDLERCIGCSACQTACQAENNIGLVGPELVAQGRLIQWMRIERYFEEEAEDVVHEMDGGATHRKTTFLPMMCQQCGNAPCEPVCPVYASYHTPDGLNAQVYNRCVGTRYCANNCPYKVRYFNYFSYEWPEPLNWQLNPDVAVRSKGIMEKCTFCVQRIRGAEHEARVDGRTVADGDIVPACAETCPGNAIVFGNIEDPNSRVAQVVESSRGFRVFEELNTQSAVVYLKKVTTDAAEGAGH